MSAELFSNPVLSENPETNETFARRDAFSQIRKADLFNLIGTFGPDTVIDIRKTHESIGILMCVLFYKSISFPWIYANVLVAQSPRGMQKEEFVMHK